VAVRRFHVLAPASLRLLVDSGETGASRAAAELGRELAERLEAHTSVLRNGAAFRSNGRLDSASWELGAETEHSEEGFDVLVLGTEGEAHLGDDLGWLHQVRHHILLVAKPASVPARVLVCVTVGEHGKADVRFAERLAWQLGAAATVLTVLPENGHPGAKVPAHVERFMASCAKAVAARGVIAKTRVRTGELSEEILREVEEENHDLLIIGAPHRTRTGRIETRSGLVQHFLANPPPCPLLLVRR
jgi:nucleotide-binding universal stress UspA family protein